MAIEGTNEAIEIAGKSIPIMYWGIAKQLEAVFRNGELTDPQKWAIAFNAGVEHAKKHLNNQAETELEHVRKDLDEVQDRIRKVLRNL